MAAGQKQTKNSYDQVFDFIFGVQKKKVNKSFPKPTPDAGGDYISALVEIGTQPAIYPLESSLDTINRYIAKATQVDFGGGVKAGFGSGAFLNTGQYVNKEVSKARAKEDFARVGGYLQHGIDGALVSLFTKNNGSTAKTAAGVGMLFSDIAKLQDVRKKGQGHIFGLDDNDDWEIAEENVYRRSIDLLTTSLVKSNPRLSKNMLLYTIGVGQKIENREERLRQTVERLKLGGLKDPKEGLRVAERLWGNGKKGDQGVYIREKDEVGKILQEIPLEDSKKKSEYSHKIRSLVNSYNPSDVGQREKKNTIYKILKNDYHLDKQQAFLTANQLIQVPKQNTRLDIAEEALYSVLVGEITQKALDGEDYDKVSQAKDVVKGVLKRSGESPTLGMRVAQARTFYNWAKDTEGLSRKLFNGEWESFGNEDLNFTQIVKYENVFDESGKKIGQYVAPARTVMGSLLGNFYYFHPRNLIKGIFLDGDLLLKMGSKWDPGSGKNIVNKKSFAYLLYQARLGNVLSSLTKPLTILSQKITGVINPLASALKKLVKNFLVRLLGATGVGGMIINLLMRLFGDQVSKAIAQITMVIMLGLLGMLLIIIDSTGIFYSAEVVKVYTENNTVSIEAPYKESHQNVFTDEDFPIVP